MSLLLALTIPQQHTQEFLKGCCCPPVCWVYECYFECNSSSSPLFQFWVWLIPTHTASGNTLDHPHGSWKEALWPRGGNTHRPNKPAACGTMVREMLIQNHCPKYIHQLAAWSKPGGNSYRTTALISEAAASCLRRPAANPTWEERPTYPTCHIIQSAACRLLLWSLLAPA